LDYFQRALTLQRAILRPGHPDLAATLREIAVAYRDLGLFQEALEPAESALAIQIQERGPDYVGTTYSLTVIAQIEGHLGHVDRALELFTGILSIRKKAHDPHATYLGFTYGHLGETQRRAGLHGEAEPNLRRAMEAFERAGLSKHPNMSYALTDLGFVHNSRHHHGQALRVCRRALVILADVLGPDSSELDEARECLGEALIGTGDFNAARKELERAFSSISQSQKGPQWTAGVRFQLARALWATPSERPRARELARTILNELSTAEGDNRKVTARIEAWLKAHPESSMGAVGRTRHADERSRAAR
jgi:tetratricopeptide (TPR) repeat protein